MKAEIVTMPEQNIDILWKCLIFGGFGSLAGVAALLRSGANLDRRAFWTAVLNSGLFSISAGLFIQYYLGPGHEIFAVVFAILSGLGGNALIEFAFGLAKIYMKNKLRDERKNKGQTTDDDSE